MKERPGVVDYARRRRWIPKQAVEPFHQDRDPGVPLRRPRIAGQHVKDDRRGSRGGGSDYVLGNYRVIAPRELGRPGGMGGRPQDVAHLRRRGQRMEVCRCVGISGRARCVLGGFGRSVLGCAVGVGRDGPLEARTRCPIGEYSRGLQRGCRARVIGTAFRKRTSAGSAHATPYPAISRNSSIVKSKSQEHVRISSSFAQLAGPSAAR